MTRECGTCTLCCKVMGIVELESRRVPGAITPCRDVAAPSMISGRTAAAFSPASGCWIWRWAKSEAGKEQDGHCAGK